MLAKLIGILSVFILAAYGANVEEWWEHMQLYQIYPRSFMDSDGDGIGDLKGIKQRIAHLADIGVQSTWLSPIFKSPMKDFGYDIEDFYGIAEEYGTLEDLQELVAEAKKHGVRVLLDFVPNHSSDQCEWFIKSAKKKSGYENYYVWHPGKVNSSGHRVPPSNWVSVFRNSAWTFHEGRQEYYLHQFLPEQPDLNYRDPKLVAEMKNVLTYWLSKGVDGFRVDAIPHLIEVDKDKNGNYPDEPLSGLTDDENDYNYLDHIYTREREETFDQVFQWRKTLDDFAKETKSDSKVLLMEAMSQIQIVMQYYGNSTHEGAHFPFNFELAFLNKDADAARIKKGIDTWFENIPSGRVSDWVAGNHDQPRVASRFGPERSDGIVILGMTLPGVSVTYQGEEIAMLDQYLSYQDTQDPQACKDGPEMYNITSRDPQRTPFQWDSSKNAGFSTAVKTWLPVADNYLTLNLENQKTAKRSAYKMYKALSKLRRSKVMKNGKFNIKSPNSDVLAFTRTMEKESSVVVVLNTSKKSHVVNLSKLFDGLGVKLEVLVTSVDSPKSQG